YDAVYGDNNRRCIRAIAVQTIHPVAHWPLVLGVLRRLEVATVIDPPPPTSPGAWPLRWAWGRSHGPRHSGWASCALQSRKTAGRAWPVRAAATGAHACRPP